MVNQNLEYLQLLGLYQFWYFLSNFGTSFLSAWNFFSATHAKIFKFWDELKLDFAIMIKDYSKIKSYNQIQIAHTLRSTSNTLSI